MGKSGPMPSSRSRFVASGLALAVAGLLAACGGSSSSSSSASSSSSTTPGGGDKTAFCRDNGDLDAATIFASPSELAQVFRDNRSKLDDLLSKAPSEVKADTQTLVDTAKVVAATGDPSPFVRDPKLQAAGQHLDSFCGVSAPHSSDTSSASGTESGSSSPTTESTSASSTYAYSS